MPGVLGKKETLLEEALKELKESIDELDSGLEEGAPLAEPSVLPPEKPKLSKLELSIHKHVPSSGARMMKSERPLGPSQRKQGSSQMAQSASRFRGPEPKYVQSSGLKMMQKPGQPSSPEHKQVLSNIPTHERGLGSAEIFLKKAGEFEKSLEEKLMKIEKEKEMLPKRIEVSDDLKELLDKNLRQNREMEGRIREVMDIVRSFETKEPVREEDFLLKLDDKIKDLGKIVADFSSEGLRKDIVVLKVAMDQMNRRVVELTTEIRKIKEDERIFELLKRVGEKLEEFELSLAGKEGTTKLTMELKELQKQIKNVNTYYENRIPDDWSDIKNDLDVALQKLAEIDLRMEKAELGQESLKRTERKIGIEIEEELRQLERLVERR